MNAKKQRKSAKAKFFNSECIASPVKKKCIKDNNSNSMSSKLSKLKKSMTRGPSWDPSVQKRKQEQKLRTHEEKIHPEEINRSIKSEKSHKSDKSISSSSLPKTKSSETRPHSPKSHIRSRSRSQSPKHQPSHSHTFEEDDASSYDLISPPNWSHLHHFATSPQSNSNSNANLQSDWQKYVQQYQKQQRMQQFMDAEHQRLFHRKSEKKTSHSHRSRTPSPSRQPQSSLKKSASKSPPRKKPELNVVILPQEDEIPEEFENL